MGGVKLSDDVIEQIKDFNYQELTKEQNELIDKLILNKELKERYEWYGLCKECKQPRICSNWCQPCNSKHFQQNFKNWTSGNDNVNKFIQKIQRNAVYHGNVLEWIDHDRFEKIEYLAKGGFGTVYKAIWKDGFIREWDSENNQWVRSKCLDGKDYEDYPVALKCLHKSNDITAEFLNEVSYLSNDMY
jgi:hypothetical protein